MNQMEGGMLRVYHRNRAEGQSWEVSPTGQKRGYLYHQERQGYSQTEQSLPEPSGCSRVFAGRSPSGHLSGGRYGREAKPNMKVLLDTCVVLDVLQHREPFWEDAYAVFLAIANRRAEGFLTAKSLTDIYYLTHRIIHDDKETRKVLSTLLIPFDLVDTTSADCHQAIASNIADFEDAVMVQTAVRTGMDFIITRNLKDYRDSTVPACLPADFLQMLQFEEI